MRLVVFAIFLAISVSSFAQTARIKELERQRVNALQEISNTNKLLTETKKTTTNLLDRIKLISNQIFSREKVLTLLGQEIEGINIEEKRLSAEIINLEAELKDKQENYAKAIEGMMQNRQKENRLLFILSGKSFTESYRRMRYLQDYSQWRKDQADEIKKKSAALKDRREALNKTRQEKTTLLSLRTTEHTNLQTEKENYNKEVAEAQTKQSSLQKILDEKQQRANALNKEIARLIAEEVARQEREERRIAEEKRLAEEKARAKSNKSNKSGKKSTPSITLPSEKTTSKNVVLSNNFASNRGKLPYPINGNYAIITRFGPHQHDVWKRVTTSSDGIDIRSQAGAEAKAVFDGEITYVAAVPGYNTCIIIRHGNYYTFYSNIQTIYVKNGDKVKTGQSLGKLYTDPDKGWAQMHFQLWLKTRKLDPEPWLR